MKKIISITLVTIMTLALLASCSGGSKLVDGTYTAMTSDTRAEEDHGWQDTLIIAVADGEATLVSFEAYSTEDGRPKSEETEESYGMTVADHLTKPDLFFPEYVENWKSNAKDIQIIAGATGTGNTLKELTEAVMKAAAAGDAEVQIVE